MIPFPAIAIAIASTATARSVRGAFPIRVPLGPIR